MGYDTYVGMSTIAIRQRAYCSDGVFLHEVYEVTKEVSSGNRDYLAWIQHNIRSATLRNI